MTLKLAIVDILTRYINRQMAMMIMNQIINKTFVWYDSSQDMPAMGEPVFIKVFGYTSYHLAKLCPADNVSGNVWRGVDGGALIHTFKRKVSWCYAPEQPCR